MALAIETTGLTKRYGPARALDGLDLEVATGEVHGLLGPNGAGKTTTLRILMGLARASGGRARLLGGDPWRQRVALHRRVAYVPGDVSLWPSLTGGEVIDVLSRFRGGVDPARRAQLVERFELDPRSRMRTYSKGNRQKVVLIAALAAPVELLVLDEPTSGLDPVMEQVFQDCVREANADGRTVLLSSHILAEVESLAHRVSIVRAGRVVRSGTLTDLRGRGVTSITADVTADPSALAGLPGVRRLRRHGSTVSLQVEGTAGLDAVIGGLHRLGIQSLTSRPPTLEELFLSNLGEGDGDGDDGGDGDQDHDPHHQHDVPQGVASWTR